MFHVPCPDGETLLLLPWSSTNGPDQRRVVDQQVLESPEKYAFLWMCDQCAVTSS